VDGYRQSAPGRKVSIYTKGALVSLMLDLTIRSITGNQASLDTVMKRLWKDFGQKNTAYKLKDFQKTCEQVTSESLEGYFQSFIHGVELLEPKLAELLDSAGCHLKAHSSRQLTKKIFGFRVLKKDSIVTVVQIDPNSPAHRKLSIGDVISRINHKKPDGKLNAHIDATRALKLSVIRNGRKVNLSIPPGNQLFFTQFRIVKQRNPSDRQKEAYYKWLGVKF
jgi:predicted metalloprotease with PDZ domain